MNNPKPKDIYQQVGEWLCEMREDGRYCDASTPDGAFLWRAHELLYTLYETYWDDQMDKI
jgi:hypothetical protein